MAMVNFKFSIKFNQKKSRIKKLETLMIGAGDTVTKMNAITVIGEFKKGIKENKFGLTPLKRITIKNKAKAGLSQPSTPLYGKGDDRSLINVLKLKKIKNGYAIVLSDKKHHTANLPLSALFKIHEHGVLIKVTPKMRSYLHYIGIHLKKSTGIIRIPPRPTFQKALAIGKKQRQENVKLSKIAMNRYIKTGSTSGFVNLKAKDKHEA